MTAMWTKWNILARPDQTGDSTGGQKVDVMFMLHFLCAMCNYLDKFDKDLCCGFLLFFCSNIGGAIECQEATNCVSFPLDNTSAII